MSREFEVHCCIKLIFYVMKILLRFDDKIAESRKKSSSLEYYWRTHGHLIGNLQFFIGDHRFSLQTPSFSLETLDCHCRPQAFHRRP